MPTETGRAEQTGTELFLYGIDPVFLVVFLLKPVSISFFVPETAYTEAEEHLATLVWRRGGDPEGRLRTAISGRSRNGR